MFIDIARIDGNDNIVDTSSAGNGSCGKQGS
jgi:hypothetical protein